MTFDFHAAAADCGLEFFGSASLEAVADHHSFLAWLAANKHAGMEFLNSPFHRDARADANLLLPNASAALVLGLPYFLGDRVDHRGASGPRIAQYGRFRDYHKTLRRRAANFAENVQSQLMCQTRVLVDTAPFFERAAAARTGTGFIGKNTMFIVPTKGSFYLLAVVLVALAESQTNAHTHREPEFCKPTRACRQLEICPSISSSQAIVPCPNKAKLLELTTRPSTPFPHVPLPRSDSGGCGSCRRCQVHCPTGALDADYQLDARKCISYYTIEHRGTIPVEYWQWLRLYVFGCDICQLVCPYNRNAQIAATTDVRITQAPDLPTIATMSQEYYVQTFGGTPLTRAKRSGLRRNALIAMIVTQHPDLHRVLATIREENEPLLMATLDQIPDYTKTSEAGSVVRSRLQSSRSEVDDRL